jgi:RNA polymerase sigma-70 factor, ECF subfamily
MDDAKAAEGFDELYGDTRDRLASQLFALTGDRQGAYDLVQDAFVRCWARWDRISAYENPEAYVRRVAFNLAKNQHRKSRRTDLHPVPPESSDPSRGASSLDEDVAQALAALSREERTAIVLRYLVGMSVDEISSEMHAPAGTVKSWLSRGRAHLALKLTNSGPRSPRVPGGSSAPQIREVPT